MSRASSWNTVEVVRPQPGQAATSGTKVRKPMVCRISCATLTSTRAVAARLGRQRDADRVADAVLQQDAERRRGGDDALRAHAGLGQAEMDRVVGARRQRLVDGDQVLHGRDLGRQDDAVARQADLLGAFGRIERRAHHRLARHGAGIDRARPTWRSRPSGVVSSSWSSEPQLAPMRTALP